MRWCCQMPDSAASNLAYLWLLYWCIHIFPKFTRFCWDTGRPAQAQAVAPSAAAAAAAAATLLAQACALGCAGGICCNGCGATASDVPKVALAGPHLEFGKSKSVLLATNYIHIYIYSRNMYTHMGLKIVQSTQLYKVWKRRNGSRNAVVKKPCATPGNWHVL